MKKYPTRLGKNELSIMKFGIAYGSNWQSFNSKCSATMKAIESLRRKYLIITNNLGQFHVAFGQSSVVDDPSWQIRMRRENTGRMLKPHDLTFVQFRQ